MHLVVMYQWNVLVHVHAPIKNAPSRKPVISLLDLFGQTDAPKSSNC